MFILRKQGQNVTSWLVWIVNIPTQGSVQKYFLDSDSDEENVMTKTKTFAFCQCLPHDFVVLVLE